jgi:hypothetical protein
MAMHCPLGPISLSYRKIERASSASRNLFGSLAFRCEAHIYSSPLQKKGNPKNVLK